MTKKNYCYEYPHPAVTMDSIVFGFDGTSLKVLLIERGGEPHKGKWAFPGGFLNMDEPCKEGALRELEEETGLKGVHLRQFHTFSQPFRDPRERIVTVSYYAVTVLQNVCAGDDAAHARWFALDEVPPLAFDHNRMLEIAIKSLRRDAFFHPIGQQALPHNFTLAQLETLYKAIPGLEEKASLFPKKLLRLSILHPLVEENATESSNQTELYQFDKTLYDFYVREGFLPEL